MTRTAHLQPAAAALHEPGPVINTTPLIDLMLVLLVMFIISIPVATHKVPLDLPRPAPAPPEHPLFHRAEIDAAGRISWDGSPVADAVFRANLAQMTRFVPQPELHLSVHAETRSERVDQLLADIRRAGVTRLGFVGNERFAPAID